MSKNYNALEPAKGMEEAWAQGREKIQILEDLIQAYDTEPVRRALADWQKDVMLNGPQSPHIQREMKLDGGSEPDVRFYEG